MTKTYLITGESCSNCDMLKKMLNIMKLSVDGEINAHSKQGSEYISTVRARSIPVLVKVDDSGKVVGSVIGIHHTDHQFREVCSV